MARKPREVYQDATYHITSRCHNRNKWLEKDHFKDIFLNCTRRALKKYNFKLIQFTIMDNHFHMIIQTIPQGESISKIMQYIKGIFAQQYNRMMNQTGPFWNERFKSNIIKNTHNRWNHFMNTTMYIGYNPVRAGLANDPRNYKYSSFNVYFNENFTPLIETDFHEVYLSLGFSFEERRTCILQYEQSYCTATMLPDPQNY